MKRILFFSYSSNFILVVFLLLSFYSCQTKPNNPTDKKELELAYRYQSKADSLYYKNNLDSAFSSFLQSNFHFKNILKSESITYNNLRIATIYLTIGDPNSAQEIITKELDNIDSMDNSFKVYLYNLLSNCYADTEDFDLATKYYNQSLILANTAIENAVLQNNIASIYTIKGNYTKSISILRSIISSNVFKDLKEEQARSLNNLGKALYLSNNKLGLQELKEALAIRLENVNQDDIYRSYINLAEYYTINKDYKSAHDYALKAYQTSKDFKSKKDKLTALEYLIKSSVTNPTQYYADYIELSKLIAKETQQAKNQFAKIRYDFEQHEKENIRLKLDLQHSELMVTRRNNALLVTFISLLLGAVVISFIYRKIKYKHRLDKIQQAYLTETKIAKKIHDELANDVFNTLTYTQNFTLDTPETRSRLVADLESIYKKARNISLQHSSITTDGTFSTHLTNLFNEYNTPDCQIIITGLEKFDFNHLDKNQKITIYRVIQELLVNMKKHSMATIVVFKFSEENNYFKIFYSDNGVGIIQEKIKSKNGLLNVENRITNIGGTFIFDHKNQLGVKYNIQLPKKNYV